MVEDIGILFVSVRGLGGIHLLLYDDRSVTEANGGHAFYDEIPLSLGVNYGDFASYHDDFWILDGDGFMVGHENA